MRKNTLLILSSLFIVSAFAKMQIYTQHTHLFKQCKVPTEAAAWNALKQKPLEGDHTYVVIPWVRLLNNKTLHHTKITKVKNGFTICQHIHFRKIIPILKQMGVTTLFTPHAEEEEIEGIKIIPFPHVPNHGCTSAKEKDLWFSFIGQRTHRCRSAIFKLPECPNVYIRKVVGQGSKDEFQNVLARSRFSLCPRGVGPSSIRFWESLQAGAIPVIIADAMKLPPNFDWETCTIRVAESEIATIPSVLRNISAEREEAMRKACLEAHKLFSGLNLTSVVHFHFRGY